MFTTEGPARDTASANVRRGAVVGAVCATGAAAPTLRSPNHCGRARLIRHATPKPMSAHFAKKMAVSFRVVTLQIDSAGIVGSCVREEALQRAAIVVCIMRNSSVV